MNKKIKISLPQFRMLRSAVKEHMNASEIYTSENKAFLGLVISNYLNLDDYDAEDAIIDGSDDGGIDAIYIDTHSEDRPVIYLFQSKYYSPENEEKFNRNFEGGALTKMKEAFTDFIINGRRGKTYQNSRLQGKLDDITQVSRSSNPRYEIVFCSNSDHPSSRAKEQFEDYIEELNEAGEFYNVKYLHLGEITKILTPEQKKKIDAKLKFIGKYIDHQSGDARIFIGQLEAVELAKIREQNGDSLFDKNVRGYLEKKNEINRKIQASASGKESKYFMYLNNGITISCEDITHNAPAEAPLVEVKSMQIVNGGQTTNSIYEVYKQGKLKPDTTILVRVLQIKKEDLLPKIILSTNNQTKVTSRDLRSNDEIQRILEKEIKGYGYFYEARSKKYKNKPAQKRVDAIKAAQAYYATKFKNPAPAKNKKAKLFSDYYDEIFNDQEVSGRELLDAFLLHEKIRKVNRRYKEKYSFVNDASLHIASLMYEEGINYEEAINSEKFDQIYDDVLSAIEEVVSEKIKEEGDYYSHRATFIDTATIGRITEALKDKKRKK